jgi:hypothetical protein
MMRNSSVTLLTFKAGCTILGVHENRICVKRFTLPFRAEADGRNGDEEGFARHFIKSLSKKGTST